MDTKMLNDFYKVVDGIISFIIVEKKINIYLNKTEWLQYDKDGFKSKENYPIISCIGGSSFILYKNIFSKFIDHTDINKNIDLNTGDYDISFSLKYIDISKFNDITKEIHKLIEKFYDEIIRQHYNTDAKKFRFERIMSYTKSKLHLRINYNNQHIAEFIFWSNNKFLDLFEIGIFNKTHLILFEDNNTYYYLLPLDLLIKTQQYALNNFFVSNNLHKCVKYITRMSYIRTIYRKYCRSEIKNEFMDDVFGTYLEKNRRIINMMLDYPYILSLCNSKLQNHGFFKCIYKKYREHHNIKYLNDFIDKNTNICEKEKDKYETGNRDIISDDSDLT